MKRVRPLILVGTRPEAIKLAPVIAECGRRAKEIDAQVCVTGQHRGLLNLQGLAPWPTLMFWAG